MINSDHIFHVYRVHPQNHGNVKKQFVARFLEHDGEFHILEDHDDVLAHIPEGPVTERTNRMLENLRHSAYIDIVTSDDLQNGRRLDMIPAHDFSQEPAAPATPEAAPQR